MFETGSILDVLVFVILLGMQYVLASRKSVYWGAIIPLAFTGWQLYTLLAKDGHLIGQSIILVIGLAFLTGQWVNGRKALYQNI